MRNSLALIMVALLVGTCAWFVWQALDKPITRIVVDNELSAPERSTLEAMLVQIELGGILSSDLNPLIEQLKSNGWAREVVVRRKWPQTLSVTLVPETAIASWGEANYLSASGTLMQLPQAQPDLPQFYVAVATPQHTMKVYRLLDQILSAEGLQITTLNQSEQGDWEVTVSEGLTLALGKMQLGDRARRFLKVYAAAQRNGQQIAYVDLRYANGAAVRFHELLNPMLAVADGNK